MSRRSGVRRAAYSVGSPPPCGEGLGVGVARCGDIILPTEPPLTPTLPRHKSGLPDLCTFDAKPGQARVSWGREPTEQVATLTTLHRNMLWKTWRTRWDSNPRRREADGLRDRSLCRSGHWSKLEDVVGLAPTMRRQ